MIVALAWSPPSHIVCRPYRPPVRSSSCNSLVIRIAPGGAERVPERYRAAVRVGLLQRGAGIGGPGQQHGGERLVDLEHVDVVDAQMSLGQRMFGRGDGPVSMNTGSEPVTVSAWIRARGVNPRRPGGVRAGTSTRPSALPL